LYPAQFNAPINIKLNGGGVVDNPKEFDCDVYPQGGGGDFDNLIFQLQIVEKK